jgi:hypothetical protein
MIMNNLGKYIAKIDFLKRFNIQTTTNDKDK